MTPFDSKGEFLQCAAGGSLRREAVRGAGASIAAAGISLAIQLAATVVLARILTPTDFGLVAMVMTFSLLLGSFGLNGFTEVIIQRDRISRHLASNLFWINAMIGMLLALGFAACGPVLAAFYHDGRVAAITEWMALPIGLSSLSYIHLALLKRALRFTTVSLISVASRTAMVGISIYFAFAGWGYWALVAGNVGQQLISCGGAWVACRWLPSRPGRVADTWTCISFALSVYSHFAFSYLAGNTDNVLVGWRFNARALGFYKKAYDLFVLPASQLVAPISAVVIATLSRSSKNQSEYRRYFLGGMSVLAFLGMGIGADFTLVGRDLVRVVLGPGWGETGAIFSLFGPGIGVMLLYNTHGWIHLSLGRPDRWFRWGIVEFLVTAGLFLLGLPFGPRGVALAWTASFFVLMVPAFSYAGRPIGFGVGPILREVWRFFAASILAGAAAYWTARTLAVFARVPGELGAVERTVSSSCFFLLFYVAAVMALHGGPAPFRRLGRLLGELLPGRSIKLEDPARAEAWQPESRPIGA